MKSSLSVIPGDWVSSPEWLNFPRTVVAKSPHNRSELCKLRVARDDLLKGAGLRRRQPAYDFWSIVLGQVPPIPGAEMFAPDGASGLVTLQDAQACFRGIKRPCADDGDGSEFIAYALKPTHFFRYEARPPLLFLTKEEVPPDLVFMAYARLDEPSDAAANKGVLTHWQFVEADEGDPNMPVDYRSRYTERLW